MPLQVATLPLQLAGFEVDPVNTVSLSNHTGHEAGWGAAPRLDAAAFDSLLGGLRANALLGGYSALLTGYVGDGEVIRAVGRALPELRERNPGLLFLCDPVMGDNGRYYVSEECAEAYREVAPLADVLTPNQFELEALAGVEVRCEGDALRAMDALHARGVRCVVTSSVEYVGDGADGGVAEGGESGVVRALASCQVGDNDGGAVRRYAIEMPRVAGRYTGTGDLLAATTLAWLRKLPDDLPSALERSLATVRGVLQRTHDRAGASAELRLVESADLLLGEPRVEHRVRRLWPGGRLPPAAPKAVVFDMDGTLTEAGNVDFSAMREMVGAAPGERVDICQRLRDETYPQQARDAWEAQIAALEVRQMRETPLRVGVAECLRALRASGARVGLLTRNCAEAVDIFVAMHGLEGVFERVETRHAAHFKPDPRSLRTFCDDWGVEPEETLYVGDSEYDMLTARATGAIFALVEDANSPKAAVRAAADATAPTLREVLLGAGCGPLLS